MRKANNTIRVYDICSLASTQHLQQDIIAENFAAYLDRHKDLHFPHRHSFYHLVFFTKGSGTHSIDFETFPVKPGQIYFMVPGQVHTWEFKGATDGYIINFSAQLLHSLLRESLYPEQFSFFSGIAADGVVQLKQSRKMVEELMLGIINEVVTNKAYSREMIALSLASVFIHIAREIAPGHVKPVIKQSQLLLSNFRKLVEQHYTHKRLPKDYAAMLYITPNHLNALCNDIAGKPAGELIRDRVLLEAKRLLVSAGITIAEIAYQLDFKDNSYFTKFFRKYTGVTPEEFRSNAAKKN